MQKIMALLDWVWKHAIKLGLLAVALSLGIFFSGIWMTLLTLTELPMLIGWYMLMVILLAMCLLLVAGSVYAIYKLVKTGHGAHL